MIGRFGVLRSVVVMALVAVLGMVPALPQTAVAEPVESIKGTVTLPGPYAVDAQVSAVAFEFIAGAWTAVAGEAIQSDGTYTIELPGAGTYRVGFFDAALVYADTFYLNEAAVTSATDLVVADGETKTGINQILVENPQNVIEGQVSFTGATGGSVGVELYKYLTIDGVPQWTIVHTSTTKPDGSYRIHTPGTGTYRIGFVDFSDTFGHVYFQNASDVEKATDVGVNNPGTPVTGINVTMSLLPSARVWGQNRYKTAVAISGKSFDDGFGGSVVLVSGEVAADGLTAGVLAYALEGPLLLTRAASTPDETMEEILRLMPYEVIIVGGPASVSLGQEITLRSMGIPIVRRLWGQDRYGTAAQVAQEMVNRDMVGGGSLEVFVANGQKFADALAVGPVAAVAGRPILFVKADAVPEATKTFFSDNMVEGATVVGGTSSVSPSVAAEVGAGRRLAGQDRYLTAASVAAYGIDELDMNARVVGMASGTQFADALAAGPYLAAGRRVIVLTQQATIPAGTKSFLTARKASLARIIVVGGPATVSDSVFTQAVNIIQ